MAYVQDLKGLLAQGTFLEQKTFLRSFMKRIEFNLGQVSIDYTIPMPLEKDYTSKREVLSINKGGTPGATRTPDKRFRKPLLYPN